MIRRLVSTVALIGSATYAFPDDLHHNIDCIRFPSKRYDGFPDKVEDF